MPPPKLSRQLSSVGGVSRVRRIEPPGVRSTAPTIVLGIDPSLTAIGLAALTISGELADLRTFKPTGTGVRRLDQIRSGVTKWVTQLMVIQECPVIHIAMEGYSFGSKMGQGSHSHSLGEAGGTIKLVLFDVLQGIVVYPSVPVPTQVKKFASGSGTIPKDQVSKHVYKKWGVDARDNNQADAYVLARIALALATGTAEFQYERDVVTSMRNSKGGTSIHAEAPNELRYEAALRL